LPDEGLSESALAAIHEAATHDEAYDVRIAAARAAAPYGPFRT
jgi:hypothetical protein